MRRKRQWSAESSRLVGEVGPEPWLSVFTSCCNICVRPRKDGSAWVVEPVLGAERNLYL